MNNKTKKSKWTAKLKALIISVILAFAVALGGAGAAIGLSLSDNNRFGGSLAGGVADENAPAIPEIPVNEDMVHEISSADQWAEVIAENSTADGYAVAKLTKNITATSGSFGTAENAYLYGALNVPAGKYIVLDLNGYTVNRGLTTAVEGGSVIINAGNLVIRDTSAKANGKITGGNATGETGTANGGGINSSCSLTLLSGTISDNKAGRGGGVIVSNSTFNMYGGTISGNESTIGSGGGLLVGSSTVNIYGGTISGNNSQVNSAGIHLGGASNLTMAGGTISGNTATSNGGGVGVYDSSTFEMTGGLITDNTAVNGGGIAIDAPGIYEEKNGEQVLKQAGLTISGKAEISDNNATNGAGVFIFANGTYTMDGGKISGNKSNGFGAGVTVSGTFTMNAGEISGNIIKGANGAGVHITSGTMIMNGGTISNNDASNNNGGGVYISDESKFTMNDGTISNNSAANGGGVYVKNATSIFEMNGGTIGGTAAGAGNTASADGGGIFFGNYSTFNMTAGTIDGNTAGTYGGGIRIVKGEFNLTGTRKSGSGKDAVNSIVISNNKAISANGGAICSTEVENVNISNVTFDGNEALQASGGAICAYGYTVTDSLFINNKAKYSGAISTQDEFVADMTNCHFEGNSASADGGAIGNSTSTGVYKINNCTVTGNSAANGGGIFIVGALTLDGTNITGNNAHNNGGGVYYAGTSFTLVGTVNISNNNATQLTNNLFISRKEAGGAYVPRTVTIADLTSGSIGVSAETSGQFAYKLSMASSTFFADMPDTHSVTYSAGGFYINSNVTGTNEARWNAAVKASLDAYDENSSDPNHNVVLFELTADWNADTAYKFGAQGSGIDENGALVVPTDANIVLDTKSFSINRGCTGTVRIGTLMLSVQGTLTIKGNGSIQGSYNDYPGTAGIRIENGGTLNLNGGTINNNIGGVGGAITISDGTFNMYGGTISGNKAESGEYNGKTVGGFGGAVFVGTDGTFNMYGGKISGNTATIGGGGIYVDNGGEFNMYDGTIGGSVANKNTASGGGGVQNVGTFTMSGGTISYNHGIESGGGIYNNGTFIMSGGTIGNNNAYYHGGAVTNFGSLTINGGKLTGNSARNGGAVYSDSKTGVTFEMNGGEISGNTSNSDILQAGFGGGGVHIYSGTFKMTGGKISKNDANVSGGGVYCRGTFEMSGGTIEGNNAPIGAGIHGVNAGVKNADGTVKTYGLTISGTATISGNTATNSGGGILLDESTLYLSGEASISGNDGTNHGGGLSVNNSILTMDGGTISGNTTSGNGAGGMLYISTFIMNGGFVCNNTATARAGGLYVSDDAMLIMNKGTISGNYAGNDGGGVILRNMSSQFEMIDGEISGNTAVTSGGGVSNSGVFTMSGTATIKDNKANGTVAGIGGGGIFNGGTLNLNGGTIEDNYAGKMGGGVYNNTNNLTITNGTIKGNTAAQFGGGLYISPEVTGKIVMSGGTICENTATSHSGGGVYLDGTDDEFELSGTARIIGNTTGGKGGGITNAEAKLTISGGEISGNSAKQGGGIFSAYLTTSTKAILEISDGTISGNSATQGGGVYASAGTFTMSGGEISGNSATQTGGGVYITSPAEMTMNGGTIGGATEEEGNVAGGSGGGVFVAGGTVKINSGSIINNTALYTGGGVYGSSGGIITMDDGEISENTALYNDGAGLYLTGNATFTMNGGAVSKNKAASLGGGLLLFGGHFIMNDGEISGNTANIGGGIQHAGGSVTLNAGSITGNIARSSSGGIYTQSTTVNIGSVAGKTLIITGNKVGTEENNINLNSDLKLAVGAALNSNSKIGITSLSETLPVTVTDGFSGKTGHNETLARGVFFADKEGEVAVLSNGEVALTQGVVLTVKNTDGEKIGSVTTVSGATVTGAFDEDTKTYTLTETGAVANNAKVVFDGVTVPDGYAAYMYNETDPFKAEISSIALSAAESVVIATKAVEKDYTIKYILQGVDGAYNETAFVSYVNSGVTDTAVVVMNENGQPFATIPDAEQYTLDQRYDNGKGVTVAGDGSTVVLVYLQLNEYTVTYNATGATPSKQTRKVKFGSTVIAPARTPSKALSTFVGWCDPSGNVIDFATTTLKVTGDMTLTAKYDMQTFHLYFDMNIDDQYYLPTDNKLSAYTGELIVATNSGMDTIDAIAAWDYEKLFPEANDFNFRLDEENENYGVFVIDYTIDNIPNTMSIRTVKPTAVGYTFDGWYMTDSSGNEQLVTTISRPNTATQDIVLKAHWSPATYTIRFDKQDGSWNPVSSTTVTNLCTIDELYALGGNPTRAGYEFDGWYISDSEDGHRYTSIDNNAFGKTDADKGYFSIAKIADLYETAEDSGEYSFSNLTLYAKWNSVPVYIVYDAVANISLTFKNADNHSGAVGVAAQAMHVNDIVTVTATASNGFKFTNLIVNGRVQSEGATEFTIREAYLTDYDFNGNTYKVVKVSAQYTEERYVINYDVDGGTSTSTNFARTYSPSELLPDSPNRAKLSSRLTKTGYDFMGWKFTSNNEKAFILDAGVDETKNLFGQNLWLATPTADDGVTTEHREVFIKAIWEPQPATVNLYNATYNNLYEGSPETGYIIEDYRAQGAPSAKKLVTAMEIKITNPVRESFDFLGWATSRNGAVVYPVVEDESTINYTVNADHDINGNALNRNNLYAVWHIKGVDRINMTVDNNGCTYGGSGITMSAKPAQSYDVADGATINLTYKWYRILDGMYDDCFTVGNVYINNGKVTGYEFNGTYYGADSKTVVNTKPAGEEFEYRRFEESSVGTGCVLEYTQNRTPSQTSTLNIRRVNDCGTYVCVVEVVATVGGDSTTRAGGYGEIAISMNKADYGNLVLESATKMYNGKAQWNAVRLALGKADGAALNQGEDNAWYLSMPDYKLDDDGDRESNTNSRIAVTYRYFTVENNTRREITDLNEIKNVGTYYVVVSFAFTPDGDKGNYELIKSIETELVITPFEISNIGFKFVHGDSSTTETFSGAYDGTAYGVEAAINSRFGLDGTGEFVVKVDDVKLIVTVNEVTENGDDVIDEADLPTVEAGRYSVVIVGLDGKDAGNYILKSGATLRKEYTIVKNVYEVSGKIKFEDDTVVFDNKLHTLEIEWEGEWPSTVKPVYKVVSYEQEDGTFTKNNHLEDNFNVLGNAGRYAGIYTIEVSFEDSAEGNYEALESMTATLTITKANLFDYMSETYGEDLLSAAGFVGGSFSFNANKSYLPTIVEDAHCILNTNKSHFNITYSYYSVDESTGARTSLDKNNDGVIQSSEKIFEPGKYEIVANIEYASSLYRNNFEEVQETESTITYVIRNVDVESVIVTFSDAFEASGRLVKYGESFNYSWIKQIDVAYIDKDNFNERSVRHIINEEDIALALITLERNDSMFWHVGEFAVRVGMYETNSEAYIVNVKQEISEVTIQYSKDEGAYATVDKDGVELVAGSQYDFQILFSGVNVNGTYVNGMLSSVETKSALKLGKNVLIVDVENYIFTEEIAVNMYKVINKEVTPLTWQYSTDGGSSWHNIEDDYEDYTLPYIGTEYLIRVAFTDGGNQSCLAKADNGLPVQNYNRNNYYMEVGRSGNYKIDAHCSIAIAQRVLEVEWSDEVNGTVKPFIYNGLHQSPEVKKENDVSKDNLAAVDKDRITFEYKFEDEDGNALGEYDVIGVGTYVIRVVPVSTDPTFSENYTVAGSESAKHTFVIDKASVALSVTYSESNYGPNVTYANNEHGLRLSAIKATFESAAIEGKFAFIKYGTDNEIIEIAGDDESIKSKLTGETGSYAYVDYAFIPDNENYNVTTGQLRLTVNAQTYKTGAGALLIELGEGASRFYLMGRTFSTNGINVYRLYESYYTEGDQWFGYRGKAIQNANLRIGNSPADGCVVDSEVVSGGMITLTAISGTNSGTLNIPVIEKEAVDLEITSTGYRTVFYLGETFDFSDLEFRVIFEDHTDQGGLTKGSVTSDFDGKVFDTAGPVVITFSCFGATCELTVQVKEKEDLEISEFSNSEKTLIWTGDVLTVPALKFKIDGKEYTEYDGIKVTYRVMQGQQEVSLKDEGKYSVYYTITITNARFNKISTPKIFTFEVTKNPYRLTIEVPKDEQLSVNYNGSNIEIPKPVIGDIIDSRYDSVVAPDSVTYTINGTPLTKDEASKPWNRLHAGTYVVEVVVEIDGREFSETYTFTINQATNGEMTIDVVTVVLGKTEFKFPVTAKFGADTVQYLYSRSRTGEYTAEVPAAAGVWFVKAIIAATDDYTGLEIIDSFEVRENSASATVGEGSIEGGDGIGKDWTLEIKQMEAEAVNQVSISKQNVHDGYEVVLKDEHGIKVEAENPYTVRVKLSEELSGRNDLNVYYRNEDGKFVKLEASVEDGFIVFKTSNFGSFIITNAQPKQSAGPLVAVIVLAIIAAGAIAACIIVFILKKKKRGAE